jgi:phospholipase C
VRWLRPLIRAGTLALIIAFMFLAYSWEREWRFERDVRGHINHVIIIVQENRSFDNLFHDYPNSDTTSFGYAHDGTRVVLQPIPLEVGYDISNGLRDFERSYDEGKMDGWDLRSIGPAGSADIPLRAAQYPQFGYVPVDEIRPYFEMADQYVLSDRMFQSNIDQSFAAHLYLIAGQAGRAINVPTGRPWGCDAFYGTTVATLTEKRKLGKRIAPCFGFRTLGDELDARFLSWRYYAPKVSSAATWRRFFLSRHKSRNVKGPEFGQLWSAYDAVAQDRYGLPWVRSVISPETQILQDIKHGDLASVTWVIPDWKNSDHSLSRSSTGPSWVAAIVNAVGESPFWQSSVILITWDDSGGWYDHVPPPQLDFDGLGVRVPLLVISPYAKRGYVSHVQSEFGSILRFTEIAFGLHPLAASDSRASNLMDCFDFSRDPRVFLSIAAPEQAEYFLSQRASSVPPDKD